MKKNININLFGVNYAINEDAYELLETYLNKVKQCFGQREGGEEIADDIEHRVAELLWEKKQLGVETIDLMTIKTILKQIGEPEEIMGEEVPNEDFSANAPAEENSGTGDENPSAKETKTEKEPRTTKRKLFRATNDKVLGGVLSGLTYYMGGSNPNLLRAIVVAIALIPMFCSPLSLLSHTFLGGFSLIVSLFNLCDPAFWSIVIYILCWILIPAADTPEKREQLMGRKETLANTPDKNNSSDGCMKGCIVAIIVVVVLILATFYGLFSFLQQMIMFNHI